MTLHEHTITTRTPAYRTIALNCCSCAARQRHSASRNSSQVACHLVVPCGKYYEMKSL
jgi:hypothetical protein